MPPLEALLYWPDLLRVLVRDRLHEQVLDRPRHAHDNGGSFFKEVQLSINHRVACLSFQSTRPARTSSGARHWRSAPARLPSPRGSAALQAAAPSSPAP